MLEDDRAVAVIVLVEGDALALGYSTLANACLRSSIGVQRSRAGWPYAGRRSGTWA
jgi:hypothetical protein